MRMQVGDLREITSLYVLAALTAGSMLFASTLGFASVARAAEADYGLGVFDRHVALHRARVLALGMELRQRFYPLLDAKRLEAYLKLHDISKTRLPLAYFASYGYRHDELPQVRLFKFFGRTRLDSSERAELEQVILEINDIDRRSAADFLRRAHLSRNERELFAKIALAADLTDRGLDPVATQEFGRPLKKASEFVKEDSLRTLVTFLEGRYDSVTTPKLRLNSCQHFFSTSAR